MNHFEENQIDKTSENEEEFVSKTQLKNEAKALQTFGKQLTQLTPSKIASLPLSDSCIQAINDFHIQSGNIAKRRHLAYIGKCLRHEDVAAVKESLEQASFNQQREVKTVQSNNQLVECLLSEGDEKIQSLLLEHPTLDRQKLRQLVRNANKAKDVKKETAIKKLTQYLLDNNAQ